MHILRTLTSEFFNAKHGIPGRNQYLDMIIKAWGNWSLFQTLLGVLRSIGDRHGGVSIANVATRWVLDHPFVGAVLVGEYVFRSP